MTTGAFSLDQLMELAGLAVSQAGKLLNQLWLRLTRDFELSVHLSCFK